MDWDTYFVFNPKDSRLKNCVEVYDGTVSILNSETRCSSLAASQIQWWVPTVLFSFGILLKIRSVRILDTIICLGTLLWLFSQARDAVQIILRVGFICPFVVINPTNLGVTIVVAQVLCLTIFYLSSTQKTCFFTNDSKVSVCIAMLYNILTSYNTHICVI